MIPYLPDILKAFLPAVIAFAIGIALTPVFTHFFYKYKLWKSTSRKDNHDPMSPAFTALHNGHDEVHTPRVGGIIIWFSALATMGIIYILSICFPSPAIEKLNFLSRNQTLVPFAALMLGACIGLAEDLFEVFASRTSRLSHGIPKKVLVAIVAGIGLASAIWFYFKLDVTAIHVPFVGEWYLGWVIIPVFVTVVLGTFSSRVIDGIDGLAGGVMAVAFAAYSIIALLQNQIDIAAFALVITGGILAFLWFNIPPARFYMGETGMLGLTITLAIIAFLTNQVLLLPIIGGMLALTSLSSTIQIFAKKIFGPVRGKIFKVAPLHHHFQALGWSREKITMRYWILSVMFAVVGIVITIVG